MIESERDKIELKEYKRQLREAAADKREEKTGMRQSTGVMVAKIACGCIFICVGFTNPKGEEWSVGYFLTALVIGIALIAWGVIPYKKAKDKMEQKTFKEVELETAMKKVDMETETPEIKQLRKFKSLLDQGLITEEDYEKKKQSLLKL